MKDKVEEQEDHFRGPAGLLVLVVETLVGSYRRTGKPSTEEMLCSTNSRTSSCYFCGFR